MRDDLARPRGGFRTREAGTLEVGACSACSSVTYKVPEGMWLHWATVEEGCPQEASETVVERPYGPTMAERTPSVLDSPERGLARSRCEATYRRPSWEWMGCR